MRACSVTSRPSLSLSLSPTRFCRCSSSRMRSRRRGLARAARLPSTSRAKPTHQSARDGERRKLIRGASWRDRTTHRGVKFRSGEKKESKKIKAEVIVEERRDVW